MTCQPLKLVSDIGELGSANATSAVTSAQTVKTGLLYVVCSDARAAGNIAVCNTANQAGVGSFHVAKGKDFLYRYGCLLYTSPSPRDAHESRMPSSA